MKSEYMKLPFDINRRHPNSWEYKEPENKTAEVQELGKLASEPQTQKIEEPEVKKPEEINGVTASGEEPKPDKSKIESEEIKKDEIPDSTSNTDKNPLSAASNTRIGRKI